MLTLSKSDFKIAQTCATKLYYKKNNYPNNNQDNEFMQALADGGYLVGKYAQLLYPDGIEITGSTATAIATTNELFKQENCILFEPAIQYGQYLMRVDVLEKIGSTYNLIEVKSKSFRSSEPEELAKPNWREYIEDVAFQYFVLSQFLSSQKIDFTINCFLLLPDKDKTTSIEGLAGWFQKKPIVSTGNFKQVQYDFKFPYDGREHKQLIADCVLTLQNINELVADTLPVINANAILYANSLQDDKPAKLRCEINVHCFKCEYKINEEGKSGFNECWGSLSASKPHISELYKVGSLNTLKNPKIDNLISEKKICLYDLSREDLYTAKGELGSDSQRRLIQIENTKNNEEYYSLDIKQKLDAWQYPIYFIDFETTRYPVPYHKNMRPNENIAFQWSCHIVESENAEPKHFEWINTKPQFPNFEFAESLMKVIGNNGTPLMWSHHENTVLRDILIQMELRNYSNSELKEWLISMTKAKDEKNNVIREGRLVDMNRFCFDNYFHPYMKGKTSIKKTLPAIWNNNPFLHQIKWFNQYLLKDNNGVVLSPYESLQPVSEDIFEDEDNESEEAIKVGTAAMEAYHQMMFELQDQPAKLENKKKLLLQYCKLDTMAMVIIWKYWKTLGV